MRPFVAIFCLLILAPAASAQGTKDPSNPVPGMVYTVNPPNDRVQPTAVPNRSYPRPRSQIRLNRIRPGKIQRTN